MSSSMGSGFNFDERLGIYLSVQSACLSGAAVVTFCKRLVIYLAFDGCEMGSLFIALHTFGVLVLRWKVPRHASKIGVAFIWFFIALVVGIPNAVHRNDVYYGKTGYWCWIKTDFKAAQILSEYLWVWASAFIMAILYGIMFLVMRGFLIIGNGKGVRWAKKQSRVKLDLSAGDDEEERAARAMANLLLFYPAVYIICVFPNSLARWLYFSGDEGPFQFTLFASTLFGFSGLFNVILYFSTRREYAVGPSVSVTAAALPSTAGYLPPDKEASHISNSREDVNFELEERYGRQPPLLYQSGPSPTANSTALSPNLILHNTTPLHQSPPSRTVPLGQGYGAAPPQSVGQGYGAAPPQSVGHLSTNDAHTQASRGNTLSSGHQLDDDENDYGRLPG
ncbi:hypothetical protein H1R20_g14517, partial [Candolleomyces eurysporus]